MLLYFAGACILLICCAINYAYKKHPQVAAALQLPAIPVSKLPLSFPITGILGHLPLLRGYARQGLHPSTCLLAIIHGCHFVEPVASNGYGVIWIGPVPLIALFRPETAEVLLSSNTNITKSVQYSFLKPWLGTGLLTSSRDKWRSRRKLLTPSFHFKILDSFVPIMAEQMKQLNAVMDDIVDRKCGVVEDLAQLMLMCALDVICGECFFIFLFISP